MIPVAPGPIEAVPEGGGHRDDLPASTTEAFTQAARGQVVARKLPMIFPSSEKVLAGLASGGRIVTEAGCGGCPKAIREIPA